MSFRSRAEHYPCQTLSNTYDMQPQSDLNIPQSMFNTCSETIFKCIRHSYVPVYNSFIVDSAVFRIFCSSFSFPYIIIIFLYNLPYHMHACRTKWEKIIVKRINVKKCHNYFYKLTVTTTKSSYNYTINSQTDRKENWNSCGWMCECMSYS